MSKTELRALKPFDRLPSVSGWDEDACLALEITGNKRLFLRDTLDIEEAAEWLKDPKYTPKGAIVFDDDSVLACFWHLSNRP